MDGIPAEEFAPIPTKKEKFLRGRREQVFVLMFVTLVTLLVLIMVLAASYLQQAAKHTADTASIEKATWSITRVAPGNGSTTDVDLTLTSSIGNVRQYSGVRSYGLSNDRQKLVLSSANGMQLVNLPDDTRAKLQPPFDYSGDQGQAISWSADDNFFAMAVYKGQDVNDTHVVIYTSTGEVQKEFKGTFASHVISGATVMFPIKFSPGRNIFIARVYKSDDQDYYKSQNLTIDQLPILLRVYNLEGNSMKEISVRDSATDGSYVVYFWDQKGDNVVYKVVPANVEVNFADEASFVRIAV